MPLHAIRTALEGYAQELASTLGMTIDNAIRLLPDDLSPNPNWRDAARDGNPEGWYAPEPPKPNGFHVHASAPGLRAAGAGVPTEETKPPKSSTLTRQTAARERGIWIADAPIVPGIQPVDSRTLGDIPSSTPLAPEVLAIARTFTGFAAGTYGWAYGFSERGGNSTPPSSVSYTETAILTGEGIELPLPDLAGFKAPFLDIYLTSANGGPNTLRLQRRVDLSRALPPSIILPHYNNRGERPPVKNQTGVGRPPAPPVGRASAHKAYVIEEKADFDLREGRYRFALQLIPPRGASLVGLLSDEIQVEGEIDRELKDRNLAFTVDGNRLEANVHGFRDATRVTLSGSSLPTPLQAGNYWVTDPLTNSFRLANTEGGAAIDLTSGGSGQVQGKGVVETPLPYKREKALVFYPPRNLPRNWRFVPWVRYGPLEAGVPSWYRMLPRNRQSIPSFGANFADPARLPDPGRTGVSVYGYSAEAEPGGLPHRMVQEDPPDPNDPTADGSAITPPDPASRPDPPRSYSHPWPLPGSYRVHTSDSYEEFPYEGPISEPFTNASGKPWVTISGTQTFQVRPKRGIALIQNADGEQKSPDGSPLDHTALGVNGVNTVTRTIEDGSFIFDTPSTVTNTAFWHRWPTVALPNGTDTVATVTGTIRVDRFTGGTAGTNLLLEELDASGVALGVRTLTNAEGLTMSLAQTGTRTLGHEGMKFGPGYNAWTDGTAYVRLLAWPVQGGATTWNSKASFKDVQIFPFQTSLRKTEKAPPENPSEAPADPDNALSPYPETSEWALGPAPVPQGSVPPVAEAPLMVVDFAGGTIPTSLGTRAPVSLPTNVFSVVEADTTSPTGTGYRWRAHDGTTSVTRALYYQKSYTDTEIGSNENFARRVLFRVAVMPPRGELEILRVTDQSGNGIGLVRLTASGQLRLYRFNVGGTLNTSYLTVLSGVTTNSLLDVELSVSRGNTNNGVLRCNAGLNGPRSASQAFSAQPYSGRVPRTVLVGGLETDSAAQWILHYFSVVDTKNGDVLNRENPTPVPTADPPISPDAPARPNPGAWAASTAYTVGNRRRPTTANGHEYVVESISGTGTSAGTEPIWPLGTGATVTDNAGANQVVWKEAGPTWRLFDSAVAKLNQWWGFVAPGAGFGKGYGPKTLKPIMVKPGQTITQAIFARWVLLQTNDSPSHHFFVTLKGKDKEPIEVGSPFGEGSGATLVTRSGPTGGMAASATWAEFVQAFVVPSGYTEMHVAPYNDCPGVYVFQEHLAGDGNLSSVTLRDAKRSYGAASSGVFRIVLDSQLEADEFTVGKEQHWTRFGASHGRPDLTALTPTYRSTSQRPATQGASIWSTSTSDPLLTPESEILEVNGTLSAIGAERPEIPAGAIFLETRRRLPVLLDENRRDFPGMVLVGDDPISYSWAEENEEPVNGHALAIRLSDEVERLDSMTLLAMTADAFKALKAVNANTILNIEAPHSEGTGRIWQIRFYSRLDGERNPMPVKVYGGTQRAYSVFTTPEAEVLSVSPMLPERGF